MKKYLEKIDTKTTGNRYDITTLFAHFNEFNELQDDIINKIQHIKIDYIAAIDALGFILGTAIAQKLKVGIITLRKGGKLPVEAYSSKFVDYTGKVKELEIRKDILPKKSRVLIVDEWIETGAQILAAIRLIKKCDAQIVGIASINMDKNNKTLDISSNYKVFTVRD